MLSETSNKTYILHTKIFLLFWAALLSHPVYFVPFLKANFPAYICYFNKSLGRTECFIFSLVHVNLDHQNRRAPSLEIVHIKETWWDSALGCENTWSRALGQLSIAPHWCVQVLEGIWDFRLCISIAWRNLHYHTKSVPTAWLGRSQPIRWTDTNFLRRTASPPDKRDIWGALWTVAGGAFIPRLCDLYKLQSFLHPNELPSEIRTFHNHTAWSLYFPLHWVHSRSALSFRVSSCCSIMSAYWFK